MPTYDDPGSDARKAHEALRRIAQTTNTLADPGDVSPVLGDLVAGLQGLRQVVDQLAVAHLAHRPRAVDAADLSTNAAADALAVADGLHQAGGLIDQTRMVLEQAVQRASRIGWQPAPADPTQTSQVQRWVSVVLLHGEEADEVLDRINRDGDAATIEYLTGWDYGDETTNAALANGQVYDDPRTFGSDRQVRAGDYALTYNYLHAHVALHRRHILRPEDTLDQNPPLIETAPTRPESPKEPPKPESPSRQPDRPGRGISL